MTALQLPDFRTSERTFQLVSQVAGRAGRAADGPQARVIVQSMHLTLDDVQFTVQLVSYDGCAARNLINAKTRNNAL